MMITNQNDFNIAIQGYIPSMMNSIEDYKIVVIYFSKHINSYFQQLNYQYNKNCVFYNMESFHNMDSERIKIYYKGKEIKNMSNSMTELEIYLNKIINIIHSKVNKNNLDSC